MKKSIVISLLTVAILLGTALYSFASTGKVTTDTLKLRKEASTDSTVIGLLSENDKVEILGEEYGWYKVKAGDKVGYVASQYINVLTNLNNENLNKDNNNNNTNADTNTNAENPVDNQGENANGEKAEVLLAGQKIYITPLINALVLEELKEDKRVEIVSEVNGWSYIKFGTTSGWVRTENIQKKEIEGNTSNPENNDNNSNNNTSSQKTGYITTNSVNFRKTPSTSGEVITKLSRNAEVKIIAKDEGWTQVEYNGNTGYVSTDYISDKQTETTSRSNITRTANVNKVEEKVVANSEERIGAGAVTGSEILEYARQYLGCKYTSGGSTPKSGFDCSGFTTYVYKHFGISLSRTSSGQSSNGVAVAKKDLAVGDVICFSSSSSSKRIGHVGIYAGGGKFIHAANSRKGVIYSNVSGDGYYFVTARRMV